MRALRFMVVAGESSGDLLAAELVTELRRILPRALAGPSADPQPIQASLRPRFFGAGGPRLAEAGVELAFDLTAHAVVGLVEVLRNYGTFRRLFHQLLVYAVQRRPDVIILVDFSGFNRRFARAIKNLVRAASGSFRNWQPRIVQYVSPQVWASREGRARQLARDVDLLLSIFPFEKEWYARRFPEFNVRFVGHPLLDRYPGPHSARALSGQAPLLLLLPGSRRSELLRHLPVMIAAAELIHSRRAMAVRMVVPSEALAELARPLAKALPNLELRVGGLANSLAEAAVAVASTGTVTLECALFGVPTVAIYKTSWSTYQIGRRIIRVNYLAMPNLLANEAVYPELIQDRVTPEAIARHALEWLEDPALHERMRNRLAKVVAGLGEPGASRRAAQEILKLLPLRDVQMPVGGWTADGIQRTVSWDQAATR